jgi:CRP/FNR family cyclic AMP-dependent transcriptional regulator
MLSSISRKVKSVSKTGKEATIGILSEGNFFGEGSLAGQALRMGSAAAMTDCQLLRIEKKAITTRSTSQLFHEPV